MPITTNFNEPRSASLLDLPDDPQAEFFICFISSYDPETKVSWCPDVRAALPHINAAFAPADAPKLAIVECGQRPEWKSPANHYRRVWNVHNVPTLARYQRVDGEVRETGRMVEEEILVLEKLHTFVGI